MRVRHSRAACAELYHTAVKRTTSLHAREITKDCQRMAADGPMLATRIRATKDYLLTIKQALKPDHALGVSTARTLPS